MDTEQWFQWFLLEYGRLTHAEFRRTLQTEAGAADPAVVPQFAAFRSAERAAADGIAALPLPVELRPASEQWLIAGRSRHTRRAYLLDLGDWLRWLERRDGDPRRAGPDDVAAYRDGLDLAAAGINRRLSALSSWYDRLGISNPVRVDRPALNRGRSPTRTLTGAETRLLLEAADAAVPAGDHPRARVARRDRMLVRLLAELGLSVAEATHLSVADLPVADPPDTVDGPALVIRGAGGVRDLIPTPTLRAHLDQLAEERRRTLLTDQIRREFTYGQPSADHAALYAELDRRDRLPADWIDPAMDDRLAALATRPRALDAYRSYRARRDAIDRLTASELAAAQPAGLLLATATGRPLRQAQVFTTVRRLARAAGLADPDRISPRGLRATAARALLDAGVALHEVQNRFGHTDPRTTTRYRL